MFSIERLRAGYDGSLVLHDVDLRMARPEVHVLVGHNGAGKTTLLHSIAGLIRPYHGRIRINGTDLAGRPTHRIARSGIALVPQGRRVWASLTVHDHLHIHRRHDRDGWTVDQVLAMFPALHSRLRQRAGVLSGGEQQMLALARALLTQPRLLLADEPAEGLAPAIAGQILDTLTALPTIGIAVLAALPDASTATRIGDRISILAAGRITATIPGPDARADPECLRRHLKPAAARATPEPFLGVF